MGIIRRNLIIVITGLLFIGVLIVPMSGGLAQTGDPTATPLAGTLVKPTKVPVTATAEVSLASARVNRSGIETLQNEGVLRVGTRFNVPPFAWLDEGGDLAGYEADIVRAIAEDIGVEVEFVQTTAETELRLLVAGEVDLLIGQQIHTKQAEEFVEFTHTYYYNQQRMVIREADQGTYSTVSSLANQRIGVVAGSRGEEAFNLWMAQTGTGMELVRYLSQDSALDALSAGDVNGVVGELDDLKRAGRLQMSLIPEPIRQDPYAIAIRRHDVNLRNLLNRSLQRLMAAGTIPTLGEQWFPNEEINYAAFIPRYRNLEDDQRTVDDFPPDMPIPDRSVLAKIRAGETLRVAGLDIAEGGLYYEGFLDPINRAIVEEMARRWGVGVTFLPDTYGQGVDLVANGEVDMAIGVRARWDGADRADYSVPYHYSGDRILTLEGSRFGSFNDFRMGSWIGYFQDAPQNKEYLESLDRSYSVYRFLNSEEAVEEIFETRDIDALFGDTIRLLAFMDRYDNIPWTLQPELLGPEPFQPLVIGVPRNDADFLTLVNWTLGEMFADGTLERLWSENYDTEQWLAYGIDVPHWIPDWPGIRDFLNERGYE
ncbi:MAG: transporter substrate-binding domain-containing protein [Chloroflexi bacterium]|nr:transporter substrate-binding domain-containing protein [Chloroflexota bacterium]